MSNAAACIFQCLGITQGRSWPAVLAFSAHVKRRSAICRISVGLMYGTKGVMPLFESLHVTAIILYAIRTGLVSRSSFRVGALKFFHFRLTEMESMDSRVK